MHAWEMYVLREATEVMTQLNGHALLDVGSEYVVLSLAMAELWVDWSNPDTVSSILY